MSGKSRHLCISEKWMEKLKTESPDVYDRYCGFLLAKLVNEDIEECIRVWDTGFKIEKSYICFLPSNDPEQGGYWLSCVDLKDSILEAIDEAEGASADSVREFCNNLSPVVRGFLQEQFNLTEESLLSRLE